MIEVTSAIQRILKQKNAAIIDGSEAMRRLLIELQRQVIEELGRAAIGSWDAYSLKQTLNAIERRIVDYDSAASADIKKRVTDMWDLGQESVYKPLNIGGIWTGFNLSTTVLKVLEDFAFHKVTGVSRFAWDKIKGELTMGILGGKTPQQVSKAIGVNLNGPSVFKTIDARAEFITKTEMGRTFSEAANMRMKNAADHVPDLEKVWHHGHPKQPRMSHLAIDGQAVPVGQAFRLVDKNGYQLQYPHDPAADFSEVAGCQCSHTVWLARWGARSKAA